jgi:hypothetical protein
MDRCGGIEGEREEEEKGRCKTLYAKQGAA